MAASTVDTCPCATRDLADLLKDPYRPLTDDERDNLDEYMSFKNHDKSAKGVSITSTVDRAIANLDHYLGFKKEMV